MLVTLLGEQISKNVLKDVFIFSYERLKRYEGEWHLEQSLMFPGCVFMESDKPEMLSENLRRYQSFLGHLDRHYALVPVGIEEERLLKSLYGSGHLLPLSKGYIRDGITYVTEGPLRGKEKMICRIDRHKRIARLNTVFSKKRQELTAGLEIVSKS